MVIAHQQQALTIAVAAPVTKFPEVAAAIRDVMNQHAFARNGKQDADAFICKIFLLDKILLKAVLPVIAGRFFLSAFLFLAMKNSRKILAYNQQV